MIARARTLTPGAMESLEARITRDLLTRLSQSGFGALGRIDVENREGIIILRGQVQSYHQKQLAQELARAVGQDSPIVNALVVVSTA